MRSFSASKKAFLIKDNNGNKWVAFGKGDVRFYSEPITEAFGEEENTSRAFLMGGISCKE